MKKTGQDLIDFAKKFIGRKYVYGVLVPKNKVDYPGSFDCAEFASYCIYQVYGILYGTQSHDVKDAAHTNAYTGFFGTDAKQIGTIVPVATAARIAGALLLRLPSPGADGHIVIVDPVNETVEAASTKLGVLQLGINGRNFDYGILLPGVEYNRSDLTAKYEAPEKVYKLTSPMIHDDYVKSIQTALGLKGKEVDGYFGGDTNKALVDFQRKKGLVVDGQLVPGGETAVALKI